MLCDSAFSGRASLSSSVGQENKALARVLPHFIVLRLLLSFLWVKEFGQEYSEVPRFQRGDAITMSLSLLPTRSKPKAIQNGTFRLGAMVVSVVRSDYTSLEDKVNPWGGYRGQLWAVPVTWPAMALWSMSVQHQQALLKPLVVPAIPPAWSLLLLL